MIKQYLTGKCIVSVFSDQNVIVVEFEKNYKNICKSLLIGNKKYSLDGKTVVIPYSEKVYSSLLDNGLRVEVVISKKATRFKIPPEEIEFDPFSISLLGKKYYLSLSCLVELLEVVVKRDIAIRAQLISVDEPANINMIVFNKSNNSYSIVESNEGYFTIGDFIKTIEGGFDIYFVRCETGELCMIAGDNQEYKVSDDKRLRINCGNEKLTVCLNSIDEVSEAERLEIVGFPELEQKPTYVTRAFFDQTTKSFHILMSANCIRRVDTLNMYIKNIKTEERKLLFSTKGTEEIIIDDLDELLHMPINLVDRYIFEYVINDKSGEVLENEQLRINNEQGHLFEEQVIISGENNHIRFSYNECPVLENKNNLFFYREKYDYDFSDCSFKTGYEIKSFEDGVLKIRLSVVSLISKIKRVDLLANDFYKNKTYVVAYKDIIDGTNILFEDCLIDFSSLSLSYYHNMRIDFMIKLTYEDGGVEIGRLFRKQMNGSTRDCSFVSCKQLMDYYDNEAKINTVCLNAKDNNLSIWFTSRGEVDLAFKDGIKKDS